jgi:hypothetical protein
VLQRLQLYHHQHVKIEHRDITMFKQLDEHHMNGLRKILCCKLRTINHVVMLSKRNERLSFKALVRFKPSKLTSHESYLQDNERLNHLPIHVRC